MENKHQMYSKSSVSGHSSANPRNRPTTQPYPSMISGPPGTSYSRYMLPNAAVSAPAAAFHPQVGSTTTVSAATVPSTPATGRISQNYGNSAQVLPNTTQGHHMTTRVQVDNIQSENISLTPPPTSSREFIPNIIIFGETGTGKSSLINMIAGREVAGISNEARGCTFASACYNVEVGGMRYNIWDTAGLNEGERGSVPAEVAFGKLRELVQNLEEGINLLVYCIRGSRFRDILKVNYDLFSDIICDGKVPVAIVVTGLENESPMESWWDENSPEFRRYNMSFAGHTCVTTIKGKKMKNGEHMFEEEFAESELAVRQLVVNVCPATPWIPKEKRWLDGITQRIIRYYDVYNGFTKPEGGSHVDKRFGRQAGSNTGRGRSDDDRMDRAGSSQSGLQLSAPLGWLKSLIDVAIGKHQMRPSKDKSHYY